MEFSKKYVNCESYMHKCAKNVLREWLENENTWSKDWFGDGVFCEYPLVDRLLKYGDCYDDYVYGFNYNDGSDDYEYYMKFDEETYKPSEYDAICVPTYDKCVKNGDIPQAILDIACVYKGLIILGIEICNKNPVSDEKKQKLKYFIDRGLKIYEVDAHKILNQITQPASVIDFLNSRGNLL